MKKKTIIFFTIIIFILVLIILYSRFIATKGLKTNEIKINVNDLNESYNGLKIVHFSDLHYGRIIKKEELESVVKEINLIKPDIVVFTGDLLDMDRELSLDESKELANILKEINAKLGKYIITGNHDDNVIWENIITESSFININDKYQLIFNKDNTPIIISGISSLLNKNTNINEHIAPIDEYINNTEHSYSILLIHEPDYIDDIDTDNYDLILSGHSHGGQVRLPFIGPIILPNGSKKYYNDYYKINNTDIYISYGLGTSKLDFRLFNKPSINFYRIVTK